MNLFPLVDGRLLAEATWWAPALSHWFWRINRSHPMPTHSKPEALARGGPQLPRADLADAAATLVSCLAAPWAALHVAYRDGASAKCMGFLP